MFENYKIIQNLKVRNLEDLIKKSHPLVYFTMKKFSIDSSIKQNLLLGLIINDELIVFVIFLKN